MFTTQKTYGRVNVLYLGIPNQDTHLGRFLKKVLENEDIRILSPKSLRRIKSAHISNKIARTLYVYAGGIRPFVLLLLFSISAWMLVINSVRAGAYLIGVSGAESVDQYLILLPLVVTVALPLLVLWVMGFQTQITRMRIGDELSDGLPMAATFLIEKVRKLCPGTNFFVEKTCDDSFLIAKGGHGATAAEYCILHWKS